MPKPSDFFVSVLSFFSVILPGAVLVYLWRDLGNRYGIPLWPLKDGEAWVAFLVAAYLAGQALYALGSWFLDAVYDWSNKPYKKWKKEREGDALLKDVIKDRMGDDLAKRTGTYPWARAFIAVRSPGALSMIERLDADSKFFRSVVVVLVVGPYAFMTTPFNWMWTIVSIILAVVIAIVMYLWVRSKLPADKRPRLVLEALGGVPIGAVLVALVVASSILANVVRPWWLLATYLVAASACFARFANQRWERDDTAYQVFLVSPDP